MANPRHTLQISVCVFCWSGWYIDLYPNGLQKIQAIPSPRNIPETKPWFSIGSPIYPHFRMVKLIKTFNFSSPNALKTLIWICKFSYLTTLHSS